MGQPLPAAHLQESLYVQELSAAVSSLSAKARSQLAAHSNGEPPAEPEPEIEDAHIRRPQWQHRLSADLRDAELRTYLEIIKHDFPRLATRLSLSRPGRDAALTPLARGKGYFGLGMAVITRPRTRRIKPKLFSAGVAAILRLDSHVSCPDERCLCAQQLQPATLLDHVLTCDKARSKSTPHNEVGKALGSILAAIPGAYVVEEVKDCPKAGFRMDLVVTGLPGAAIGARALFDHTIRHPVPTNGLVGNTAAAPALYAIQGHEHKITKYKNHLQPGDTFLPVALETYGTTTKEVVDYIRKLAWAVYAGGGQQSNIATKQKVGRQLHRWRSLIAVALFESIGYSLLDAEQRRWAGLRGAVQVKMRPLDRWAAAVPRRNPRPPVAAHPARAAARAAAR